MGGACRRLLLRSRRWTKRYKHGEMGTKNGRKASEDTLELLETVKNVAAKEKIDIFHLEYDRPP